MGTRHAGGLDELCGLATKAGDTGPREMQDDHPLSSDSF